MPWGFIQELPVSAEEYDRIDQAIQGDPEGLIIHTASEKSGRIRVIDIWESKDAYKRFESEQLMPAVQSLGSQAPTEPPSMDEFEVHNIRGRGRQ